MAVANGASTNVRVSDLANMTRDKHIELLDRSLRKIYSAIEEIEQFKFFRSIRSQGAQKKIRTDTARDLNQLDSCLDALRALPQYETKSGDSVADNGDSSFIEAASHKRRLALGLYRNSIKVPVGKQVALGAVIALPIYLGAGGLARMVLDNVFPEGTCGNPVSNIDPNADYKGGPPTTITTLDGDTVTSTSDFEEAPVKDAPTVDGPVVPRNIPGVDDGDSQVYVGLDPTFTEHGPVVPQATSDPTTPTTLDR